MSMMGDCPSCRDTGYIRDVQPDDSTGRMKAISGYCPVCRKGQEMQSRRVLNDAWRRNQDLRAAHREPPKKEQIISARAWMTRVLAAMDHGDKRAIECAIAMHGERQPRQACVAAGIEVQ